MLGRKGSCSEQVCVQVNGQVPSFLLGTMQSISLEQGMGPGFQETKATFGQLTPSKEIKRVTYSTPIWQFPHTPFRSF